MTEPVFLHQIAKSHSGGVWVVRAGQLHQLVEKLQLPPKMAGAVLGKLVDAASACRDLYGTYVATPSLVNYNTRELTVATAYEEILTLRTLLLNARVKGILFPIGVSLRIALDALEGLSAMHLHAPDSCGGVTPDQLWVGPQGVTKVANVGLTAITAGHAPWKNHVDRAGYLAHEQVTPDWPIGPRTDVYGIAVLLWEMFSGKRMLVGSAAHMQGLLAEGRAELTPAMENPQVSDALVAVLERALQPQAEARFQTLHDFSLALQNSGTPVARPLDVAEFFTEVGAEQLQSLRKVTGLRRDQGVPSPSDEQTPLTLTKPFAELEPEDETIAIHLPNGYQQDVEIIQTRVGVSGPPSAGKRKETTAETIARLRAHPSFRPDLPPDDATQVWRSPRAMGTSDPDSLATAAEEHTMERHRLNASDLQTQRARRTQYVVFALFTLVVALGCFLYLRLR